jgi:hypothetical protein
VVNARFDPALFDGPFDLILHYAVLEHIEEPAIFLAQQAELLADEGVIACAVPSCGRQLEVGDLGMIVHEHWSYFTPESLRDLVVDGGGAVVDVQLAGVGGGAIYAAWRTGGRGRVSAPVDDPAGRFAQRAERSLAILRGRLEALDSNNRTLGIYCPARFFNYHHLLADSARPRIRYFDDDPHLAGRYYPPLPVRVEPRDTLLDQPVDELLIMSWSFGDALAAQLRSEPQLGGTALVTIGEIFG